MNSEIKLSNVNLAGDTYGSTIYSYTDVIPETEYVTADAKLYVYRVVSVGINPTLEPDPDKRITGQPSAVSFPNQVTYGWDMTADSEGPILPAESIEVKNTKESEQEYRNIVSWPLYTSSARNSTADFAYYKVYRYVDGDDIVNLIPKTTITSRQENLYVDRITKEEVPYSTFEVVGITESQTILALVAVMFCSATRVASGATENNLSSTAGATNDFGPI